MASAKSVMMKMRARFRSEPIHDRAKVIAVQTSPSGQVLTATVQAGRAIYSGLSAVNHPIGMGAIVSIELDGDAVSGSWVIVGVEELALNAGATDPTIRLSTPDIFDITTTVEVDESNNTYVVGFRVLLEMIREHYYFRVPTQYFVEVLTLSGNTVLEFNSPMFERVSGYMHLAIDNDDTTIRILPYGQTQPPSVYPPPGRVILEIGNELVVCSSWIPYGPIAGIYGAQFNVTERGYGATTASAWPTNQDVVIRGVSVVSTNVLFPNTPYFVRVRCVAADGRESGWSEAVVILTDVDTTPTTWTDPPGASFAGESRQEGILLTWTHADLDYFDFQHYQIRYRDTPAGPYYDPIPVGSGTSYVDRVPVGTVRYYQLQTEDHAGNHGYSVLSSWSPEIRVAHEGYDDPPGAAIALVNPTWQTNAAGWTFSSMTGTALYERLVDIVFDSIGGSGALIIPRTLIFATSELRGTSVALPTTANRIWVKAFLSVDNHNSGDECALGVELYAGGTLIDYALARPTMDELTAAGTNFIPVSLEFIPPSNITHVAPFFSYTATSGAGTIQVRLDAWQAKITMEGLPLVGAGEMSSDPGAAAKPLKTTAAGGIQVRRLSVGTTGVPAIDGEVVASVVKHTEIKALVDATYYTIHGIAFLTTVHTLLASATRTIATYNINVTLNTVPAATGVPNSAEGVFVRVIGQWPAVGSGIYVEVRKEGSAEVYARLRSPGTSSVVCEMLVPVPINKTNQLISLVVIGGSCTCSVLLTGWVV